MKLYIAYGSNLNVDQMRYRCPGARVAGVSEMKNHWLTFRGNSHTGVANIEPHRGAAASLWRFGGLTGMTKCRWIFTRVIPGCISNRNTQ